MEIALKKLLKKKNITFKIVNNHKINYGCSNVLFARNLSSNNSYSYYHNINKELENIYESLTPVYQVINNEFDLCDLIDLDFYERWLNE